MTACRWDPDEGLSVCTVAHELVKEALISLSLCLNFVLYHLEHGHQVQGEPRVDVAPLENVEASRAYLNEIESQ